MTDRLVLYSKLCKERDESVKGQLSSEHWLSKLIKDKSDAQTQIESFRTEHAAQELRREAVFRAQKEAFRTEHAALKRQRESEYAAHQIALKENIIKASAAIKHYRKNLDAVCTEIIQWDKK